MNRRNVPSIILLVLVVLAMAVAGCKPKEAQPAAETAGGGEHRPVKVALILGGAANDMSWDYDAFQTLTRVTDQLEYASILGVAENVAEGDAEPFMRDYAEKGANLIIANSFGFWDAGQKVTADYPDLVVVFPGGDDTLITEQVGTYYPLTYQATYLTGMTAGLMTKSNKVGYIVSNPIPPLLAETNSFVQGARDANPNADVSVIVTGSWYDPPRESEAAQAMIDDGVDFIGFELNALVTIDVAKKNPGVLVAPPFLDQRYLAPNSVAVCSLWSWDSYYKDLIEKVSLGTWKSGVEYWGIDRGMADISEFGPMIPADVAEKVTAKRQEIIDGKFKVPYVIDRNLWEE